MTSKKSIHQSVFLAEGSRVVGDVTVGKESSIWFNAVLRGDDVDIVVGERTNIQDNAVVHGSVGYPTRIGNGVTVGHGAIVHGCSIGDNSLIGMGSIILNGAKIGKNCIVAAGALVTQNAVVEDGTLVMGSPAKPRRKLTPEEIEKNRESAIHYMKNADRYR